MRLASALLSALILTIPLLGCAALYSWYEGLYYSQGTAPRLLLVGAIMFIGLTCGILCELYEDEHQD